MAKVKIVTDSSAQLTDEEIKEYGITVIPLTVMVDDTVYVDQEEIDNDTFVQKMIASKNLPKTSQPPVGKFVELFDELGRDGSQVLSINMLEAISGTVHTAEQAANLSSSDVTVVDSQSTDRGLAFQVLKAAELANDGADLETIIAAITEIQQKTKLYLCVLNLDNIVKGGRLNPVAGAITNFLNIKVVLEVKDGSLNVISKGRGVKFIKKFVNQLVDDVKTTTPPTNFGISYVTETDLIDDVAQKIRTELPQTNLLVRTTSPIIATHTGEGAFALIFY